MREAIHGYDGDSDSLPTKDQPNQNQQNKQDADSGKKNGDVNQLLYPNAPCREYIYQAISPCSW